MKTRFLHLSKPTTSPTPEARRRARRPERTAFRPDIQQLEERISLSGLGLGGGLHTGSHTRGLGLNHNETLLRGRRARRTGR
jgi:hypothetical protein